MTCSQIFSNLFMLVLWNSATTKWIIWPQKPKGGLAVNVSAGITRNALDWRDLLSSLIADLWKRIVLSNSAALLRNIMFSDTNSVFFVIMSTFIFDKDSFLDFIRNIGVLEEQYEEMKIQYLNKEYLTVIFENNRM